MVKDNNYFLISGFISLSLFTFFLVLFFSMIFSSSDIKSFALVKDNYISISITTPIIEAKKTKKSVTQPVEEVVAIESENVDIDDLFSDVWTQNIKNEKKIQKKKPDNKRLQNIQKRIKTSEKKEISKISDKISDIDMQKPNDENNTKVSTSNEVNEYLAKIQALVYKYFNPPLNSQGHSVKAVIKLSAIGKVLDFRILNYSANLELNEECDRIKDRLMNAMFPLNPDNKTVNYIIILTSKE